MKRTLIIAATAALGLGAAASAEEFSAVDADASGLISLEEVQAIAPDVTEAQFSDYDSDLDGGLNEDEFATWDAAMNGEPDGQY